MRRFAAILLALVMIFALCACGKEVEEPVERDCGVYVTVEASDVYSVSFGTEEGGGGFENADGSAIPAGEVVHFDFAGEAAEGTQQAVIDYSICIYDKDLNILAIESFSSDFSNMAKVEITVTEDHRILNASDKLICGGDTIVSIKNTKPASDCRIAVPTVTMPNRTEAAKAINDNIAAINEGFAGKQLETNRKTYKANVAAADDDIDDEILGKFSMTRSVDVSRGDSQVLSIRMLDKINLGTDKQVAITGHNFNAYDGSELKLVDITDDPEKLISVCAEDILISTTEYSEILYNEGYTETIKDLISDGHWYLNSEGLIVAVNPGEIADVTLGCFEFCVTYDILEPVIKAEYLPASIEGDTGDINADLAKNCDTSSLTLVGAEADKEIDSVLVTVTGKIANISVYNATYKSGSYTLGSQRWYCSDLSEGAAFAINHELEKTPDIFIGFTRPDGTYERRLLSLDSEGNVSITDPDGGEKGTSITDDMPYSVDLNSDETQEKISASKNDDGFYSINVASADNSFSKETVIKKSLCVRLYDIGADGNREIFVYGKNDDGDWVTYCMAFDGELKTLQFGKDEYASGSVKEFEQSTLYLKLDVDILGSYTGEISYKYSDGSFTRSSSKIKLSGTSYVKTAKELPLSDGKTIPADYKIKFLETDGESYISFTTNKGLKGEIAIEKSDSGWTINGNKDASYFESLPYDD